MRRKRVPSMQRMFSREAIVSESRSYRIRPYTEADATAAAAVVVTSMQVTNAPDYPAEVIAHLSAYNTPEQFQMLVAGGREILLAEDASGRVVGTGGLDAGQLVTLFVLPDAQGHGIGAALVAAIEQLARTRGLDALTLRSSITAVRFYERLGYEQAGRPRDGEAGVQIPMRKPLASAPGDI